ncbi:MAG: acyl transferase [Saprospiraceae bacterium]|nr:acyl transferase [Saprospiraceae bacterium]
METFMRSEILSILDSPGDLPFEALEDKVYAYQLNHNALYCQFVALTGNLSDRPSHLCLPISFFKSHAVKTGIWESDIIFTSSGTTGQQNSQHLVRDRNVYLNNALGGFEQAFGDPSDWVILGLLPSYLERQGSSLVAMVDALIKRSKYTESGFFLNDFGKLGQTLKICRKHGYKIILFGVSFALLDFAEYGSLDLEGVIIMETGGMKGRRVELTRETLQERLKSAFGVSAIYSEYGMTELFSQAYTKGGSRFYPASTMRVFTTEINDPFALAGVGKTGVLNIVDLANFDTCSFIQTEDIGRMFEDGSFEVLGRLDAAELRGCNLMVE